MCLFVGIAFAVISGFELGTYYSQDFMECTITKQTRRNCYEVETGYKLKQYFLVNDNTEAFVFCGHVKNCDKNCSETYAIGERYYCNRYNSNSGIADEPKLYQISKSDRNHNTKFGGYIHMAAALFVMCIMLPVILIWVHRENSNKNVPIFAHNEVGNDNGDLEDLEFAE